MQAAGQPPAESGLQGSELFLSYVTSKDTSQAQLPTTTQGVLTEDGRSTHPSAGTEAWQGLFGEGPSPPAYGDAEKVPLRHQGIVTWRHHMSLISPLCPNTHFRELGRGEFLGGCHCPPKEQLCLLIPTFHFKASSSTGHENTLKPAVMAKHYMATVQRNEIHP